VIRRIGTAVTAAFVLWAFAFGAGVAQANVIMTPPATPQLATSGTDGSIEVVRQITQCGNTMYAVGLFSAVKNPNSNTAIPRNNAFAFSAGQPNYNVLPWNPDVNGQVDTVACAPDGDVYLGGSFTTVGGTAVRNLAKVNGATGANNAAFTLHPSGRVAHVEIVRDSTGVLHLLVGGYAAPYLRSVDALTGANQNGYLPVTGSFISGTYQFTGVVAQTPRIYNMTVFPAPYQPGSATTTPAVLMTGIFTNVGAPGQHHEQVFRLNILPGQAQVSGWSPTELYQHCFARQPFYAQDAAWSTTGDRIFVVTTGYRLNSEFSMNPRPQVRTGPCDAAISYPATEAEFDGHPNGWVNYTGCDSLYAVAADASTVFIAGHERWINNGLSCDRLGTGGRAQPGLGEIDRTTGLAQAGPDRGRGLGANDLLRTSAGLWIASDNQANTDSCGRTAGGAVQHGRMGICFLPGA
jgi:hypothetical protein